MESKLVQRITEYLEYTKNRKDISRENKKEFLDRMKLNLKYIHIVTNFPTEIMKFRNFRNTKCDTNDHPWSPEAHLQATRFSIVKDIDNPTDREMALLIQEGDYLNMLGFYEFLYGKQKARKRIFKVAKRIRVATLSQSLTNQEMLDFLAAVPSKFIHQIDYSDRYCLSFDRPEIFEKLCQKNPMYYKELEFYVTYKDKGYYKQVIENSEIGDTFKQCFVITKCCSKGLITRTDAKVLKELAGLVRLYSYDRDKIIDCILDSK
jgi:hypothetical protein